MSGPFPVQNSVNAWPTDRLNRPTDQGGSTSYRNHTEVAENLTARNLQRNGVNASTTEVRSWDKINNAALQGHLDIPAEVVIAEGKAAIAAGTTVNHAAQNAVGQDAQNSDDSDDGDTDDDGGDDGDDDYDDDDDGGDDYDGGDDGSGGDGGYDSPDDEDERLTIDEMYGNDDPEDNSEAALDDVLKIRENS